MKNLPKKIKDILGDESGAAALEYGLLAALIAAVIVVVIGGVGISLGSVFEYVKEKLIVPGAGGG